MKTNINKTILFIIISVVWILIFCASKTEQHYDPDSIIGKWETILDNDGNEERYIFEFENSDNGFLGSVYSYTNGRIVGKMKLGEIKYNHPDLDVLTNVAANIRLIGSVDLIGNRITGRLQYDDGSRLDLVLTRLITAENDSRNEDYSYSQPEQVHDGLSVAMVEEVGIDRKNVENLIKSIRREELGMVDACLIMRNGKLVLEEYFNGFTRNDPHFLSSATKAVSGLITGAAYDSGFLKNIDQPVFDLFPEYHEYKTDESGSLTIRHILQMRGGFDIDGYEFKPGTDIFKDALNRRNTFSPGSDFLYDNALPNLLAGIVKSSTGMYMDEFAKVHFFNPLGIRNYDWNTSKYEGHPICQGTLKMLPRDMIKIGSPVLSGGIRNNRRILSKQWIHDTVRKYSSIDEDNRYNYGYLWWIYEYSRENFSFDIYYASGSGGQFIFVIPELDAVIVFTGSNYDGNDHIKILSALQDEVVPLFLK